MTSAAPTATTTQVYRVWIKATPEAIWDAITKPEWTARYGYGGIVDYDLRPGRPFVVHPSEPMASMEGVPDDIIDGEVVEADPPRRLSLTWRMLMDPACRPRASHADLRDRAGRRAPRADGHPRARGRAELAAMVGASTRPRAPAAAGPGSCPTSSRCWRPARPG